MPNSYYILGNLANQMYACQLAHTAIFPKKRGVNGGSVVLDIAPTKRINLLVEYLNSKKYSVEDLIEAKKEFHRNVSVLPIYCGKFMINKKRLLIKNIFSRK